VAVANMATVCRLGLGVGGCGDRNGDGGSGGGGGDDGVDGDGGDFEGGS
jgi:hypothetical protein